MIFNISPSNVSYIEYNGTAMSIQVSAPREAFEERFAIIEPSIKQARDVTYYPQKYIYFARNVDETECNYDVPVRHPTLKFIHENFDMVKFWVIDYEWSRLPPSKYHVYNYETHRWDITPEDQVLLDKDILINDITFATQLRLDTFAQTRNYDGILSLCTYANSPNETFRIEGEYGLIVRDATWSKLYQVLSEVEAGQRPKPTGFQDIESELPVLSWPN